MRRGAAGAPLSGDARCGASSPAGLISEPGPSASAVLLGRTAVAVQAAQYSSSLAMRLIHSTTATGTAKAPYMLLPATPCR